jgi:hypothetical protein
MDPWNDPERKKENQNRCGGNKILAVRPASRRLSSKVRIFIEHLEKTFALCPSSTHDPANPPERTDNLNATPTSR